MTPTEPVAAHRVLLVDDDGAVRAMMSQGLERKGFEVATAASVTEALRRIATESFDVLITDLHMPEPGDGFTVVSAMRHSQPTGLICEDSRVAGPRSPSGWLPGPPRAGSSGNLLAPKVLLRSHRSTPDRHVGGRSRGPGRYGFHSCLSSS